MGQSPKSQINLLPFPAAQIMSSGGRRPGSSNKSTADTSRPGSSNRKTATGNNRLGSKSKQVADTGVRNKSNSASDNNKRLQLDSDRTVATAKVGNLDGRIKVLGQDAEMSETEIWNQNGMSSGKSTPLTGRSSAGRMPPRQDSSLSYRTPTPSKQISLQAVRRKEENHEPLETIDWNDFVEPVSMDEERTPTNLSDRIPSPPVSDSEDSDKDSGLTMEDRLLLVEKRAQEMTSALSSHPLNNLEEDLSKQLERVEIEREQNERLEKLREESEMLEKRERQNNENFRDFESTSPRLLLKDSEIVCANSKTDSYSSNKPGTSREPDQIAQNQGASNEEVFMIGARPKVTKTENISREDSTHKEQRALPEDAVQKEESKVSTAKGITENAEESSTSDESDEEDDLIGRKGKAPNQLLMEFLDCMMTEDYTTAEKLCKMILIYEPENPEALSFLPVIQEKIKQEEEEDEESDEESDSDDDDDEDDDDENDDDDDSSSEESEEEQEGVPDSGVVSANSD